MTAVRLDCELQQALSGEMTPKFLATLDATGRPNCVPVISLMPYADDVLIFGEFFMNKSRKNLLENPKVGIAAINERFEMWSLKGMFLGFETAGECVDRINALRLFRYNAYTGVRAAGVIRIHEVSEKRRLTKPRLLLDFARVMAVARVLQPRCSDWRCMPPRVEEKFRRMAAVRAAAYCDADGFPRAFAGVACVPAGPNRLVMGDSLFAAYAGGIPRDGELAVAVITSDPIAYQVKGLYRGRRAGVGVVDLTACYSASPPLLGERLDPESQGPACSRAGAG